MSADARHAEARVPSENSAPDTELRTQLVRLALKNARRSVALLLAAGGFVAWLGWDAGATRMAALVAAMTVAVSVWRFALGRHAEDGLLTTQLARIEWEISGNALLSGLLWAAATAGIYPELDPRAASAHIVVLVGSAAIAAHFLTLVRWSYGMLLVPSIGALAIVSLLDPNVRSYPLVVLSVIYIATLLMAGREYRATAIRALQDSLQSRGINESLRQAKEDAEAGALAKSQFLATMSHEIRTPMNGVLGSLELLRRSGLNQEQQRLARTAASSGNALMAILNDVLDHSKIEAGKLELRADPMSLHDLVASIIGLFRGNAEARGLSLVLKLDDSVPDWVVGDSQRLKQVLLNLVSNAIKFTDHGGVELSVHARPSDPASARLLFAVRDTGVGMSQDVLRQLFTPFTQFRDRHAKVVRGTGLGLSISQRIAQTMGSSIRVESSPGEGSRFSFELTLPLYDADPPAAPETAAGGLDPLSGLSGTVLVAEDDLVSRMVARSMLESLGLTVVEAADGIEALAQGRMHTVDMVFMDCQMPNLDGYAAASRWRERELRLGLRPTPIVAMTANAFPEDVVRSREAGMDAHLAKPYTRQQLRDVVRRWLHHHDDVGSDAGSF
jgi:signal transduction histidine kinase/ActR/RegA family two-component response regulator